MKEGVLLFNMIQNWEKEYPEFEPYQVLEFISKDKIMIRGYSACNEYGYTDFLPPGEYNWFVAANQDTIDAFLGETKFKDGKIFCKVVFSTDLLIKQNISLLINELTNYKEVIWN